MLDKDAYFRDYAAELGRKNARLVAQILFSMYDDRAHMRREPDLTENFLEAEIRDRKRLLAAWHWQRERRLHGISSASWEK